MPLGIAGSLLGRVWGVGAVFAVLGVAPNTGSTDGDTDILVEVTSSATCYAIDVGGAWGSLFDIVDATHVSCRTPPHLAGAGLVAITVYRASGSATLVDAFTYTAGAAIDPATLDMTLFNEDFAGVPWVGKASVGTSASRSLVGADAAPDVGASHGGHASADLDPVALQSLVGDAFAPGDVVDLAGFYFGVVFKARTVKSSELSPTTTPVLIGASGANFGLLLGGSDQSGGLLDGVSAYIFASGVDIAVSVAKATNLPAGPGEVHFAQMWLEGAKMGLNVDGDVARLSPDVDMTWMTTYINAWSLAVGKGYVDSVDGEVLAVYGAKTPFTPEIRAGLLQYTKTKFSFAPNAWVRRTRGEFPGPSHTDGWNPRDGAALVQLGSGRILYIGGWSDYEHWGYTGPKNVGGQNTTNEVWASDDEGVSWVKILAHDNDPPISGLDARFKRSHTRAVVEWNGIAVVMGADHYTHPGNEQARGEVWHSNADGTGWTLMASASTSPATDTVPPPPFWERVLWMCGKLGNDLYCIGGVDKGGYGGDALAKKDMWKSSDGGVSWTELFNESNPLPWGNAFPRGMVYAPCEHNGKLYVLGGGTYGDQTPPNYSDYNGVFAFNGTTWETVLPDGHAQFPNIHYNALASYGGRLWHINGYEHPSTEHHTTRYSEDNGATWTELPARAGGPASHADATLSTSFGLLRVPGAHQENGFRRNLYVIQRRSAVAAVVAPVVTSVSPSSGLESTATALVVEGTDFVSGCTVKVNGVACTGVAFVDSTEVHCDTPSSIPAGGPFTLRLTNPDAKFGELADAFTFGAPGFAVLGVFPSSGTLDGETELVIEVTDSATCYAVDVGGAWGTVFAIPDATHVSCKSPAHVGTGLVAVTVYNGVTAATLLDAFTYTASEVIDLATRPLTLWSKASFTGVPWAAVASAGTSLANGDLTQDVVAYQPTVGFPKNGFAPAAFYDGSAPYCYVTNATDATVYWSASAGMLACAVFLDPNPRPASGNIYDDAAIARDGNADVGLTWTTAGITAFVYSGGYKSITVPAKSGWHRIITWWDSAFFNLMVDGVLATPLACGALTSLTGLLTVGLGYGGVSARMQLLELVASNVNLSADVAGIDTLFKTTYDLGTFDPADYRPALFLRAGNYVEAAGVGTWTADMGVDAVAAALAPAATAGAPTFTAGNNALSNAMAMSEAFGTGECHAVCVATINANIGEISAGYYADHIFRFGGNCGFYYYRSGAGPYQYWAGFYKTTGVNGDPSTFAGVPFAAVEITSFVDAAGAGRVVLQGKIEMGKVQVKAGSGSWIVGGDWYNVWTPADVATLDIGINYAANAAGEVTVECIGCYPRRLDGTFSKAFALWGGAAPHAPPEDRVTEAGVVRVTEDDVTRTTEG